MGISTTRGAQGELSLKQEIDVEDLLIQRKNQATEGLEINRQIEELGCYLAAITGKADISLIASKNYGRNLDLTSRYKDIISDDTAEALRKDLQAAIYRRKNDLSALI